MGARVTIPRLGGRPSAGRLARVVLDGDPALVAPWLGPHELPVDVRPGAPAVVAVAVRTSRGEVLLEPAD